MTLGMWPKILFTETGTMKREHVCRMDGKRRRGKNSVRATLNQRNFCGTQEEIQNLQSGKSTLLQTALGLDWREKLVKS